MSNWKSLIPLVLVILFSAVAAFYFFTNPKITGQKPQVQISPSPNSSGFINFPKATPQLLGANAPQTQPQTGTDTLQNVGITLNEPQSLTLVSSPAIVAGSANVFEGLVQINIKDENGKILGQGQATACMDVKPCLFKTTIPFENPTTPAGTIEVYSQSPKDGSPEYLQTITIRFD